LCGVIKWITFAELSPEKIGWMNKEESTEFIEDIEKERKRTTKN